MHLSTNIHLKTGKNAWNSWFLRKLKLIPPSLFAFYSESPPRTPAKISSSDFDNSIFFNPNDCKK